MIGSQILMSDLVPLPEGLCSSSELENALFGV